MMRGIRNSSTYSAFRRNSFSTARARVIDAIGVRLEGRSVSICARIPKSGSSHISGSKNSRARVVPGEVGDGVRIRRPSLPADRIDAFEPLWDSRGVIIG
jgi:hypothetical protein